MHLLNKKADVKKFTIATSHLDNTPNTHHPYTTRLS